ncbi:protein O-mannosyl-transferase TMTC1-like [Daktulosphaira vitifoliae]|uniref:protein O-mannosyl-transferase TMTC1-like n=1 Tax=Daktulosphaira vitifoliae TaxID=58002 RepID=UPI0021A9B253|nr:protein O-mannosyl-transferase TMTC1-like [Daktulosphaira vitifoliae]XP_050544981.1 protein O-mannosyl-transferase TMTC1-like [Daktulosphaira vitifoliae]XP_050544982.1 protein O-mannosyl-transferase TMTC1-like [Daktulosphaira vitifoliae]XP_050544983.1 protein O-mannosyl-transferase TMTC1-like [Daktulosphaira vitifoliae]XP_050544984.1 protein O-mannosyl-transferase TMTC1-like [Daktulosphaira vitifoliae]XP_050544985.1 protein O-mannosyl-transferase TMTC1-like [Daktulosphaira vitifoliae]
MRRVSQYNHHHYHHHHNHHDKCRKHSASRRGQHRWPEVAVTVYLTVAVAVILSYWNGLNGDFVHDDIPAITMNGDVLGTNPILQVVTNDFWGTPMADPNSHKSYRPLTTLTFRMNHYMFGLEPVWFHLINVVLHGLCSVLFARLCIAVAGLQYKYGVLAGVVFAIHPIHTEAVTGIVGRADILACLFFLLSFLTYHESQKKSKEQVLLSCTFGALSMLAKETGLMVLLVNLAYDIYSSWTHIKKSFIEKKHSEESRLFTRRALKTIFATAILLTFRLYMLQGSLPKFTEPDNPAAFHDSSRVRLLSYCYVAVFNLWLMLCPSALSHDWQMNSLPLVTSVNDIRNLGTCVVAAFLFCATCKILSDMDSQKHVPQVLAALLLVVPYIPASNLLVTVGFVVAERVLYIPSMGLILWCVYGLQTLMNSRKSRLLNILIKLLVGLTLIVFVARTAIRNSDWLSRPTIIKAGLKTLPHNAKMHYNWANYRRDVGDTQTAVSHYREALRLWPSYASAHNNLGTLMERSRDAEHHFLAAIRFSPGHVNAHYNLGQVYRLMNRTKDAVAMLERCLRLNSGYTAAYLLLAKMHTGSQTGRLLKHVATYQPKNPDHQARYAKWLHDNHHLAEALFYYKRAMTVKMEHRDSVLGLARVLRDQGQKSRVYRLITWWQTTRRSNSVPGGGRIVFAGDLYVKGWQLYKQGQTTAPLPSGSDTSRQCNSDRKIAMCNSIQLSHVMIPGK